jgi:hypothetical protein
MRPTAAPGNWYAIARFAQITERMRRTANAPVLAMLKPRRINSHHLNI